MYLGSLVGFADMARPGSKNITFADQLTVGERSELGDIFERVDGCGQGS